MSKGNATENDWVKFVAQGTALPSYGATLQVNLHIADPGEAGTASSAAPTFTGYAPVTVSRDAAGWTICNGDSPFAANPAGNAFKNTAEVTFPECTGGADTITHASLSVVATGQLLYKGALPTPINVSNLITFRFPAGTLVIAED